MEFKTCNTCGVMLPLTYKYFGVSKGNKNGFRSKCKECCIKYSAEYRKLNKEKVFKSKKKYYDDNKEKISEYYYKNKIAKRKYREDNKGKLIKYSKQYRDLNKDKIIKEQKIWCKDNKYKLEIYRKKYRESNVEKLKCLQQKWHSIEINKVKCNLSHQKYRAIKRNLPSTLTADQWNQIKKQFNDKCAYCEQALPLAQEHFIPLSKGGEYTHNNIIPSCQSCNSSKGAKNFFEWYPNHKSYSTKREKIILKFLNYDNEMQQLSII